MCHFVCGHYGELKDVHCSGKKVTLLLVQQVKWKPFAIVREWTEKFFTEKSLFHLWARSMSVMALVWVPVGRAWGRLVVRVAGTQGEGRSSGGGGSRGATRASKGWSATLVSGVVFATWKNLNSMKNGISYSNRSRYWSQKFINNFLLDPLPTPTFFVFSNLCSCN